MQKTVAFRTVDDVEVSPSGPAQEFKIKIVEFIEMRNDTVLVDQSVFDEVSKGRGRSAVSHRSTELPKEFVKLSGTFREHGIFFARFGDVGCNQKVQRTGTFESHLIHFSGRSIGSVRAQPESAEPLAISGKE